MIGTIENIEFTSGGAGNQWTTIDGVKYATYWNFNSSVGKGIKRGAHVEFEVSQRSLWSGMAPIPHAHITRIVEG
jgi:hypothetical protein